MSNKFVYQNAQIKNRESKLLTLQGMQRLLDATCEKDAMKVLIELGFGVGANTENCDFDEVFVREEQNLSDFLKEMNVANALDVFLLENDYLNLKVALKAKACGGKNAAYLPSGLYDVTDIVEAVESGETQAFDKRFKESVDGGILLLQEENVSARGIDTYVDKRAYAHIFASCPKSGKLAKEYYAKKVDFANISSFARCKRLGLRQDFFEDCFISGGKIAHDLFEKDGADLETLALDLKDTPYAKIVGDLACSSNLVAFEVASENALLKMWKDEDSDMFSIAPIVAYYLTKKTELKVAKLIVAGIKNHVASDLIKERMRELYA